MELDYYSLLRKAVAGKDAAARERLYQDARGLIGRSHLTREAVWSQTAALQDAIRRIEEEFTVYDTTSADAINEVLSTGRRWKPLILCASAIVAILALSALIFSFVTTKDSGVSASASRTMHAREDAIAADLKPGVDGGSTGEALPYAFQRQVVFYRTTIVPGSIVVDRESRFLYLIDSNNSARRYGIGVAQECLKGGSFFRVANKMEWPDWKTPDTSKMDADGLLASAGRPGSSLGARALLLDKPGLLIHGTNSPKTIGHLVASGCIRLVNDDVEDLYRRVSLDTRVIFVTQ